MKKFKPKLLLCTLACLVLLAGLFALRPLYDRFFYEGRPAPDLRAESYRLVIAETSLPIPGDQTMASISPHRLLTTHEQIRGLCELINGHSRRLTVHGPETRYYDDGKLFTLALEREDGWTDLTLYQESDRVLAECYDRQTQRSEYWVTDVQLAYDVADYLACGENPLTTDAGKKRIHTIRQYIRRYPSDYFLNPPQKEYENNQTLNEAIEELWSLPYDWVVQKDELRSNEMRMHYSVYPGWSQDRMYVELEISYFPEDMLLSVAQYLSSGKREARCLCLDLTDRDLKIVEYLEELEDAGAFDAS